MNAVMNPWVPWNVGNFLIRGVAISFSRRVLIRELVNWFVF